MLANIASWVGFDQQIEVSQRLIGRNGGVAAHNFILVTGDFGGEGDVLTDRKAEDICLARKSKAITTISRSLVAEPMSLR